MAVKMKAVIVQNNLLMRDIFSMWLQIPEVAQQAKPGQFITLFCKDCSRLLPRPISICEIDQKRERIRIVYRVAGKGTQEFSMWKEADEVDIMGPLGNGFILEGSRPLLIGGGIGIPPMLELAKHLTGEIQVVLGYRDVTFMDKEFETYGKVYLATEDGSRGTKGNVFDAIRENNLTTDMIFACGPTPMLRGIKAYAQEHDIIAQLSLEERMACGIGACLGCVCKTKETDSHTHVKNKRICKDGPVFYAK
jgi:dihydroorotate dehydrogenase electron transfer subunit